MNKKILWASPTNILDITSGFALSVKEMLLQLHKNGYDIKILSATIFNNEAGMSVLQQHDDIIKKNDGKLINISDDGLIHETFITKNIDREKMQSKEEFVWFGYYCKVLNDFKPDFVFFYRNGLLELAMAREAKINNIPTVVYLANPNYSGTAWLRDVDLIITDSEATAKMYKEREGYDMVNVGKFLPKKRYVSKQHKRKNLLFINPTLQKGALFVIQLALYLEKVGSDIIIEVVNSRGNWTEILQQVSSSLGEKRYALPNVIETENTKDMKSIYARARLLLVPSFWFESAGRVILEAQLNGIPVMGSSSGGIPEMIGKGGIIINFSDEFYKKPYTILVGEDHLKNIYSVIERFYNDEQYYETFKQKALKNVHVNHNINNSTKRLIGALNTIMLQTLEN